MTAEGQTPEGQPDDFTPRTFQPTRKDRLRPLELIGFSAGMAAFVGLVVLLSTREPVVAAVSFGVAFIVVLVAIAMFSLTFKPDDAEIADLDEQDSAH
ncbi:hypothetical protein [Rathayibacter sp. VKM Ac-2759]|uniref:hypothetical protein n=1 Tax=Rathayibacter sp. VKM Ac-2759 TaxID=2609252 RepID=UPI001FCA1910|nr:hypothetical protein [Rathayibacter sp. VKM Ac-2759]